MPFGGVYTDHEQVCALLLCVFVFNCLPTMKQSQTVHREDDSCMCSCNVGRWMALEQLQTLVVLYVSVCVHVERKREAMGRGERESQCIALCLRPHQHDKQTTATQNTSLWMFGDEVMMKNEGERG